MAKARCDLSLQSHIKPLLRLLQFANGRKVQLRSDEQALWFEDMVGTGAGKCRITAQALQQAISSGLFSIGEAGLLIERPEANAFRKRYGPEQAPEGGNVYALQHQSLEEIALASVEPRNEVLLRNRGSSCLLSLERLKATDGRAYFAKPLLLAGEKLVEDFTHGQLQPRITASWQPRQHQASKGQRNHACDISESAMQARLRFNHAVSAIGPELSGVVVDAVCFEKGLELIERERQWPARSAKLMLRTGLEILSRHYQPRPSSTLRSWADQSF